MLQGMGINERGWARMASSFGRVVLIQQGFVFHVEIWKDGRRLFNGPETRMSRWRLLDEILLGTLSAVRTFFLTLRHTRGRRIDAIIASNYHNTLAALLLRLAGKSRRVVAFLTDYLPPCGPRRVRLHRRLTSGLMEMAARLADEVWALSPRITTGNRNPNHFVVPICICDSPAPPGPREEVAYIGFPSQDHALDFLFEICRKHGWRLNIIGSSPHLDSIRHLAPPDTVFHGLLNDEETIRGILARCFCGYAIYRDVSPNSYSYYGFPSKTLYNFASETPVVITNAAAFNHRFQTEGVGRVVSPDLSEIEGAMLDILANYPRYAEAIRRFRHEWNAQVLEFHRARFAALGIAAAFPSAARDAGGGKQL